MEVWLLIYWTTYRINMNLLLVWNLFIVLKCMIIVLFELKFQSKNRGTYCGRFVWLWCNIGLRLINLILLPLTFSIIADDFWANGCSFSLLNDIRVCCVQKIVISLTSRNVTSFAFSLLANCSWGTIYLFLTCNITIMLFSRHKLME